MAEEAVAAVETPVVEVPAVETPAASETAVPKTPVAEAPPAAIDPNDPMAALEAAMKTEFGEEKPAEEPPAPIPEQFQAALTISDFVKTPENVQQAVRAADEVWKVATGQIPARTMLEGIRQANPQAFEAIRQDLAEYLGVQAAPDAQASAIDGLKASNPAAYAQLAQWFQETTGKPLEGPVDPNQARLDALESAYAQEQEARQVEVWNQQVGAARTKAIEFLDSKTKGTAFEGMTETLMNLVGQKAGIPQEQMVQLLLSGKTDKLEAAYKSATADLGNLVKQINANLIKKNRALQGAVPASKGVVVSKGNGADAEMAQKPGESNMDWRMRLWNSGKV